MILGTIALETLLDLQHDGKIIPRDLSLLCWDDARVAEVVRPPISALHRDLFQYGVIAARQLVAVLNGEDIDHVRGTTTELILRRTTARLDADVPPGGSRDANAS